MRSNTASRSFRSALCNGVWFETRTGTLGIAANDLGPDEGCPGLVELGRVRRAPMPALLQTTGTAPTHRGHARAADRYLPALLRGLARHRCHAGAIVRLGRPSTAEQNPLGPLLVRRRQPARSERRRTSMTKRRRFTPEFQAQVVLEVLTGRQSPAEACRTRACARDRDLKKSLDAAGCGLPSTPAG